MGAADPIVITGLAELKLQLEHPTGEAILARAHEVFGNPVKAERWLGRPRKTFNNRSPQEIAASNDVEMQREVLGALIAVEFGTVS